MKKILFVLFASLLVLSACGNDESKEEKKSEQKEEKKAEKKEKKQEDKINENTQTSSAPQRSNEENSAVNNNQQPTAVDNGNQVQNGQQVAKQPIQQDNQQTNQLNKNSEEYQRYLDAQALDQDYRNNPQKYENAHIGGGPGLTSPQGESFQQYQERVKNGEMPSN
ncbi:hypothetical protein [Staphylococcus agnetis]|uniref:hypothetical protein n=1 Tax=Staphylococcus agnetis TaxID=985762 RepID=UPI001300A669|nr:hypothetical protein [Staphylococcus agnetis]